MWQSPVPEACARILNQNLVRKHFCTRRAVVSVMVPCMQASESPALEDSYLELDTLEQEQLESLETGEDQAVSQIQGNETGDFIPMGCLCSEDAGMCDVQWFNAPVDICCLPMLILGDDSRNTLY